MRRAWWDIDNREIPEFLHEDELNALLEAAKRCSKRDYLILALMGRCGLRVSEVCGKYALRPCDIDVRRRVLRIRGKGDKVREVPVPEDLLEDLLAYIREEGFGPMVPIFQLTDRAVRKMVKRYARLAGIEDPDRVHPHMLRHTYATQIVIKGGVEMIPLVKKLLGHKNIQTTLVYAKIITMVEEETLKKLGLL